MRTKTTLSAVAYYPTRYILDIELLKPERALRLYVKYADPTGDSTQLIWLQKEQDRGLTYGLDGIVGIHYIEAPEGRYGNIILIEYSIECYHQFLGNEKIFRRLVHAVHTGMKG